MLKSSTSTSINCKLRDLCSIGQMQSFFWSILLCLNGFPVSCRLMLMSLLLEVSHTFSSWFLTYWSSKFFVHILLPLGWCCNGVIKLKLDISAFANRAPGVKITLSKKILISVRSAQWESLYHQDNVLVYLTLLLSLYSIPFFLFSSDK